MADDVKRVVLQGKMDSVQLGIRTVRRELHELNKVRRSGTKLSEEQKARVNELKSSLFELKEEQTDYRVELRKSSEEQRKATEALKKADAATKEAAKNREDLKNKTLAAGAAVAAFAVATGKAIKAQAEQAKVEKQLSFAISATGKTRADTALLMARAQEEFADSARETLFTEQEQAKALALIIRTTGKTTGALTLLRQAQDAATASGKELADSAKAVGEAATGDLGPLKELGILSAEQITQFNKLTDASHRATRGFEELETKVGGARLKIGEAAKTGAQLTNDLKKLQQAAGDLALTFIDLTAAAVGFAGTEKSAIENMSDSVSSAAANIQLYRTHATNGQMATDALKFAAVGLTGPFLALGSADGVVAGFQERLGDMREEADKAKKSLEDATRVAREFGTLSGAEASPESRQGLPDLPFGFTAPKKEKKKGKKRKKAAPIDFGAGGRTEAAASAAAQQAAFDVEDLEVEFDLREKIAQLTMDGRDFDAERLAIMSDANLTPLEKELALKKQMQRLDADIVKKKESDRKLRKTADKEREAAGFAVADSAVAAAGTIIENEAAVAAMEGAVEFGRAWAAYPDPAGMAAHGAASVALFAAAAKGGKGGGGGGGGGAGASRAAGGGINPQIADGSEIARENARAIADELGAGNRGGAGGNVINQFFRSVRMPSDAEARVLLDATRRAQQTEA